MKSFTGIVLIIIVLLLLGCLLYNYNLLIRNKVKIKKIVKCIHVIETHPEDVNNYEIFIKTWKESGTIEPTKFLKKGYYHRILKICATNSNNIQSWQLLKEVLKQYLPLLKELEKSVTLETLMKSLIKEFDNPPIKERIMESVMLLTEKYAYKMQFINHLLSRSIIVLQKNTPNCYILDIPIRISYIGKYKIGKYKKVNIVNLDLISFQMSEYNFTINNYTISEELLKMFNYFVEAVEENQAETMINFIPRKLLIYKNYQLTDINYLHNVYQEYIRINNDLEKIASELSKIQTFMKMVEKSESDKYQEQMDIYQRKLNLLSYANLKAIDLRNKYFQSIQECILSIYLKDIQPDLFNVQKEQLFWHENYQSLRKDYDSFQSIVDQYYQVDYQSQVIS